MNLLHTIEPLIDIRKHLIRQLSACVASLHSGVAERALLLIHCPVLLCLIKQYKSELLPDLVSGIMQNVHRNESEYLIVLWKNGTYT